MDAVIPKSSSRAKQDVEIAATVRRERRRLLAFILGMVRDAGEAEDVLQEAFFELVSAYRMMQPIEQAGAWLRRVARNRIIDRVRKKSPQRLDDIDAHGEAEPVTLLPSVQDGPEAALLRQLMMDALEAALESLPPAQRAVFIAHEIEGVSFKALSAREGVPVNTLLARKRYAVLRLRARLQEVYEDWIDA